MSFEISLDDGRFLVDLVRKTISLFLETRKKLPIPKDMPPKLNEKCGVFVTLNSIKGNHKYLRGCIGYPLPNLSLIEATIDSAINAATSDPRFPPVSLQELEQILLEISVLTPPKQIRVDDPRNFIKEIRVGHDGLIVERGVYKGLLLPQVAVEWRWDAEEFLNNCCMKAGLTPDAWLIEGTKIYKFSCILVKELTPKGVVVLEDMRN
jgi:uncharacterized protein (TIGR00296 family)